MYPVRTLAGFVSEIRRVVRAGTPAHGRLRDRLVALAITTVGFDLLCGLLALLFERGEPGTQLQNFGDAIFWTTTQLLTVSSNLRNPISTPARILDVIMEMYAITIIATLAAAVGAFLIKRGEEMDAAVDPAKARVSGPRETRGGSPPA